MKRVNFNIKDRKMLYGILAIALVCVFTLTIVYAALSATLNIVGAANVDPVGWNITVEKATVFENLADYYSNYSNGGKLIMEPTIVGTTVKDFKVSLTKPGEGVIQYFKITNNGTIPAVVVGVDFSTPSCVSDTGNSSDANLVCNNLEFRGFFTEEDFLYSEGLYDGYKLEPGDFIYLCAGVIFPKSVTSVPSSNITISNLTAEALFEQCADDACSNASDGELGGIGDDD